MSKRNKVLFIGLDAAETSLISKWMADGSLPNLSQLCRQGLHTHITRPHEHLVGLPWPMFYTGTNAGANGAYHYLQWDPNTMATKRLSQMGLPLDPFWRKFGDNDPRAVVIDMPLTPATHTFNGVEISGWATQEQLDPLNTYPADILAWADAAVGTAPAFEERYGTLTSKQFLQIRNKLVDMTRKVTRLAKTLMDKENWDLFMVVYSATHRGGHQLWNHTNVANEINKDKKSKIEQSLQKVYIACDQAVGELIDTAGDDTDVLVCSLHGMGINHSRSELLPEMTSKILDHETESSTSQRPKLLSQIRNLIPSNWRHAFKKRLPFKYQDFLTSYWRMGASDYSEMPVISLLCDHDGYLQINLKGRESQGIVEPGEEYEAWIKIITDGLNSFVDADTGKPVVKTVYRREDLGIHGRCLAYYPDLIVLWHETSASKHRKLTSPQYGDIPWPTPGRNPEGQSGNHRQKGFLMARGARFNPNSDLESIEIIDLAPTILDLLGLAKSPTMEGNVIYR